MKSILFIFLFTLYSFVFAQQFQFERKINPFVIIDAESDTISYPFFGGLNTPVIQFVDINGNSFPDLFIQDRASQLIYYENSGSEFNWQTDNFGNLEIGSWFKFADIDQDNDFDLFTESSLTYIRYYKNTGSTNNPNFVIGTNILTDVNQSPISLNGFSIPEWSDIDNDGQPELFFGLQDGHIAYYEYTGLDSNEVPLYSLMSDTFENIQILTGGGKILNSKKHGANSMTFADIDSDNDNDLFWGDFFAPSIIFIENTGTGADPELDQDNIINQFPAVNPIQTGGFNVPRFADIDSDNDVDMFIGIIGGSISTLTDREMNFYFFENTGSASQYNFELRTKTFIQGIDLGQNTIPAFVDIDNDGDSDLFIANQEDLDSPSVDNSRIYFYENIGSVFEPVYQLADSNYLEYDKRFDTNYSPAFVDVDNDLDYDLFLGKWDGKLTFYRNDGTVSSPNFIQISEYYAGIDIGNNSTPAFADIDNDNDFDLFIGEYGGNINFYRNIGNPDNPTFVLDTTTYFNIDAGEYSFPFFIDIDGDMDLDLFTGSDTSGTFLYRNDGNAVTANFVVDNSFKIPLHLRSSPNFLDIDNDGDMDLISGNAGGGLVFYSNQMINTVEAKKNAELAQTFQLYQNYPNPFNPVTHIKFDILHSGFVTLKIYNIKGQLVSTLINKSLMSGSYSVLWNAKDKSSGIYFYALYAESQQSKIIKMTYLK